MRENRNLFKNKKEKDTEFLFISRDKIINKRKSKLCRIHKCADKSALASEKALRNSINSLPEL